VQLKPEELQEIPEVMAFASELCRWRELAGISQKKLAAVVVFDSSYVGKAEQGKLAASRKFAEAADQHLRAGRALIRRWRDMHEVLVELTNDKAAHHMVSGLWLCASTTGPPSASWPIGARAVRRSVTTAAGFGTP
jgi:Helix-turn-helix domain